MARPSSTQPTDVELKILQVLWQQGTLTARGVHNALARQKQTNYSTTVKMLAVMLDKGLVTRDESRQPFAYRARLSREITQRRVLRQLVDKLYDGSAKSLVLQALAARKSSKEDLAEIRRLLRQLEERL